MGFRDRLTGFLLALILAATPAAASDPFVTVAPPREGGANSAFWIMEMQSRPTGTSVAGLALAQINAALGPRDQSWCAAEALTPSSFTSPAPAIQAEIRQYLSGDGGGIFRATTNMTGVPALAIVGNYRSCAGQTAPFLLLVDQRAQVPRLLYVHMFTDWMPFIALHADGNRLVVSSCLECDHAEILSYNRRRHRFTWRSVEP